MYYSKRSLFQYVFDASSPIYIERNKHMDCLRKRHAEVILPEKVAEEVRQPGKPLKRFIERFPDVVTKLSPAEEELYLRILKQLGIHEGEAAVITVALSRWRLPIVIEDRRARTKAENHGLRCLSWQDFVQGAS
ncbi:MAG: hypothetical protein ACUVV0_14760 [Anaerolineae bacterium]